MEEFKTETATLYYTEDFLPMYVYLENGQWIYLSTSTPPVFLDTDPDIKKLKDAEFTYSYRDALIVMGIIAAAARAKAEELKMAEEEEEEEEDKEDVLKGPVDVAAVTDPATKRTSSSGYNIYNYLTGSTQADVTAARINQAIKKQSYTLAADGKSMTKSFGDRTITIHENGGMSSNPVTSGRTSKVAAILANDLLTMLRTYAVLYQKGADAALPEGIINLRLNQKGLSTAQERAHILLTKNVEERFYAELNKFPNAYPIEFLKKFKLNGNEIRLDLIKSISHAKRKPDTAPDATPDAKKPAAAPAPAATSDYLKGVITNLGKGVANPDDADAKKLLISILDGSNKFLAAEGNVVKPKENKTDPKDQAALTKALGLLQEVLSKHGYDKAVMPVNADSMTLPKTGKDMAAEIKDPPASQRRMSIHL